MTKLPTLIRDTREQKGFRWNKSKSIAGTVEKKLDHGDYAIEGYEKVAVVERKGSASELLKNLLTDDKKRFHRELEELSKYPYAWIVCEFNLSDMKNAIGVIPKHKRRYFSMDKILGAIASINAQYGVSFIFAGPKVTRKWRGKTYTVHYAKDITLKLLRKAQKYHGKKTTNAA